MSALFSRGLILFHIICGVLSMDIELKCKYDNITETFSEVAYSFTRCIVDGAFNAPRNTKIVSVNSNEFSNDTITYFYAESKAIKYIPLGLGELYENLLYLFIYSCKLVEVNKGDLKHFKKLRILNLNTNYIEYLQPYLFEHNPDIEFINFYNNKISFIDPVTFEGLFYLEHLDIRTNTCVNSISYRRLAILNAVTAAVAACKATTLKDDFDKRDKFLNIEHRNSAIEALWSSNMTNEINELRTELKTIKTECGSYRTKCSEYNEMLNEK